MKRLRELIKGLEGLFVADLDEDEMKSFIRCISDNMAVKDYSGSSGLMGLSKIKWIGP